MQLLRLYITGDDDLLVVVVQSVKRVKERFLCLGLAFKKLNVINELQIDAAISSMKCRALIIRNRIDEIIGEIF